MASFERMGRGDRHGLLPYQTASPISQWNRFSQAYGIEKSAISERFIQASREKLKTLMERPLGELKLCALVIDGTPFKGRLAWPMTGKRQFWACAKGPRRTPRW
jgi:hypothetical protein